MTDLRLTRYKDGMLDISFDGTDLETTDSLENAVSISVEGIARARVGDELPDNSDRKRGWFGDAFLNTPEDTTGSRKWILSRSKMVSEILSQVKQIFEECLQWMLEDGVAAAVRVQTAKLSDEVIAIRISIKDPSTDEYEVFDYFFNWKAQRISKEVTQ